MFTLCLTANIPLCMGATTNHAQPQTNAWSKNPNEAIAAQLGWVADLTTRCGGYYLEAPFTYPEKLINTNSMVITSDQPFFSFHGTSFLPSATINRLGQQITANKAYLYRDPTTGKINAINLFGDINLREPRTLVVATKAHLDLKTKEQILDDILYRTAIYSAANLKPAIPNNQALQNARQVYHLSAWGQAAEFAQHKPKVYELKQASYSTCPPLTNVWEVKASEITLDKNSGRGVAKHARLYIKKIPVFYTPYFNFPIDNRRKTGFLFPFIGRTTKSGEQLTTPFYWNLAPNYDTTITPTFYTARGLQAEDIFRYLTPSSGGKTTIDILPHDKAFSLFKESAPRKYGSTTNQFTLANLRRLEAASPTRGAFAFEHQQRFNDLWSMDVNYNYVTDDYYLSDLRNSLNETTQNQLLQQADVNFNDYHWNFTGRVQGYQTLHPVDVDTPGLFINQYSRLPQLILNGAYPNNELQKFSYFANSEITHFDIKKMPGSDVLQPMGNRLHVQPGISLPLTWPFLYITPRLQAALTKYELRQVPTGIPSVPNRALPIFDLSTGMYFDRNLTLFGNDIRQTLEPQLYYTYIPYRNQFDIPVFDTIETTLTYDQLFTYNRFSGIDRIGDANQVSLGLATRFIDNDTGIEKIHAGIGEIIYFRNREVTICSYNTCPSNTIPKDNKLRRSPVSASWTYLLTPGWTATGTTIWNTQLNEMSNQSIAVQYSPDPTRIINLGYNFVRNGDVQPGLPVNSSGNNLKQTDFSFAWPLFYQWSVVGRLTKSINQARFQNILSGLQYDSCCWAIRFVAGRTFLKLAPPNASPQYDTEFYMQFALKGLGNFGFADPSQLLSSSIPGYSSNFGKDY